MKASVRWSQRQTRRSPCTTCEVEIYLVSGRVFIVKFIVKLRCILCLAGVVQCPLQALQVLYFLRILQICDVLKEIADIPE